MIPESGFCEIIPKAKDQLCKSQQKPPKDPLCIVPGDQNLKWLWGGWSGWEHRPRRKFDFDGQGVVHKGSLGGFTDLPCQVFDDCAGPDSHRDSGKGCGEL